MGKAFAASLSDKRGIFPYAAGENQPVQPSQHRMVGADVFPDPVTVHAYGKLRFRIAVCCQLPHPAHVADPADPLEAAFLVEDRLDLPWGKAGFPFKVKDD